MRVRNLGLAVSALGILIGAGGCTSESPTSPLAPSVVSAAKTTIRPDSAAGSASADRYAGSGSRTEEVTVQNAELGGYAGSGF